MEKVKQDSAWVPGVERKTISLNQLQQPFQLSLTILAAVEAERQFVEPARMRRRPDSSLPGQPMGMQTLLPVSTNAPVLIECLLDDLRRLGDLGRKLRLPPVRQRRR